MMYYLVSSHINFQSKSHSLFAGAALRVLREIKASQGMPVFSEDGIDAGDRQEAQDTKFSLGHEWTMRGSRRRSRHECK